MKFIIQILLTGLVFFLGSKIIPGVHIDGFGNAILVGIVVALVNSTVGLILKILTFPINFLTLGLLSFIITVLMIMFSDYLMSSFELSGFFSAALLAIFVAIVKPIFHSFVK